MKVKTMLMCDPLPKFYTKLRVIREILHEESGGNLIEYTLAIALIGLGVTAIMNDVAVKIGMAFTAIHDMLATYFAGAATIQKGN